jgi:hypothetical protein
VVRRGFGTGRRRCQIGETANRRPSLWVRETLAGFVKKNTQS